MTLNRCRYPVALVLTAVIIVLWFWLRSSSRPDALWHIVNGQCVPHQQTQYRPAPCASVNLGQGYVVFKDRNGPLQYLLMPVTKVSGMESPELLTSRQTNYFLAAWRERHFLEQKLGRAIPVQQLSFAVNSRYGRSQNQLHIHMSCLKPAVQKRLEAQSAQLNTRWQPIDNGINGHQYWARALSADELAQSTPFRMLADGLPGARNNMGSYGLALVPLTEQRFVLLATRLQLWRLNLASIEEIQDHSCPQLYAPPDA
ncbi:CDP-diacylglycerol diphosphatase [Enterobacillus tribolii]|uniref:CDP-diacylglycerol pyrophosphatase n=1 Tax=Enterobacillus tribolii TaxID=1487935 RepID=A0A370QU81_9GAMM|nr:CDP-diacylglycerol diphosphatase [Enterobacillus tribolii]MBW7981142.1 CDP-diacylglycerol diphosphatase [Enterobacillus tribolii]RDK92800.1 CDP-diacylglycerol pyrophosphatase [Enterobacillus tribolii]